MSYSYSKENDNVFRYNFVNTDQLYVVYLEEDSQGNPKVIRVTLNGEIIPEYDDLSDLPCMEVDSEA